MKTPRISEAIGNIPEDLVSGAVTYKRTSKKKAFIKWGSIAACFMVMVMATALLVPMLLGGNSPDVNNDRYKDYIIGDEYGIIWPWEYQTVYEQYTVFDLDGLNYQSKGRAVSADLVGDLIGTKTIVGYDEINGKTYTKDFEVYELKYADKSQFVAVKMDGKYYTFKKDIYAPPNKLGELLDLIDLSQAIELSHFSENGDSADKKHYTLNDDDYIWEVIAGCRDAAFIDTSANVENGKEYLSFTITSETLGVYKVAMYVTKDGYLWTNAFSYQYLFNIGKDAAGKIIKHAKENSTETEYEPYRNTVAGTITEITDDYILVDDSVLCKNPEDGIVIKCF